jgi:hypothetical protein
MKGTESFYAMVRYIVEEAGRDFYVGTVSIGEPVSSKTEDWPFKF